MLNFQDLKQPILGISPMDGVSDHPFRFITKKYGNPDLIYTEFTHVHGLCVAGDKLLHHFFYDKSQSPIIAQIYGKEPEYFYHAAKVVCELGFDGVDINMGCPAKNVAQSGSGAALIKTPDLAREIVAAVKEGVKHWVDNGELTGLAKRSYDAVLQLKKEIGVEKEREEIPVSIKTRIGYDKPITTEWISNLMRTNPSWIAVHGRTLKQMYEGKADWNELKKAVEVSNVPVLVNGDIDSRESFEKVIELTKANGALIGRGTYGNPCIFKEMRGEASGEINRANVLVEHVEKFVETFPDPKAFYQIRKHLAWYCKGFDGASEVRRELMKASTVDDVKTVLKTFKLT